MNGARGNIVWLTNEGLDEIYILFPCEEYLQLSKSYKIFNGRRYTQYDAM